MIKAGFNTICAIALMLVSQAGSATPGSADLRFEAFMDSFAIGYQNLNIPDFDLDYRENIKHMPPIDSLYMQLDFFNKITKGLSSIKSKNLTAKNRLYYAHIAYEARLNKERLRLQMAYRNKGHTMPEDGLHKLDKGWYEYYIHFMTGVDISPEDLYRFGEKEVAHVHQEIKTLQNQMGYENDSAGFYRYLASDEFILTDKSEIIKRYQGIKKIVYKNIGWLFEDTVVADISFMEWPDANKYTPPGYYSNGLNNKEKKDIFYFNFYGQRHNIRSMDWLFMHEGVPGHHYQVCMRNKDSIGRPAFKDFFFYAGNQEGWAAYIEYSGKEMGLYTDAYSYLGKWEWDLVRSTRILIDVGIHHYGWTQEQAIACWKKNIPGQDAIAEREVLRCTHWPAQALSYKVGAQKIMDMRDAIKKKDGKDFDIRRFHSRYLAYGSMPLEVIAEDMMDK